MKSASLQYANALADIAIQQNSAPQVVQQLLDFGALFESSPELRNALASPAVERETKHKVAEELVNRIGGSRIVRNFLFVAIDHQRTHVLPEIIATFQDVIRQRQGVADAEVVSAAALNDAQKEEMLRTLEQLTGRKVQARYTQDPALLGGAVVRIGDTIYDGSLRNRLNQMRDRLAAE